MTLNLQTDSDEGDSEPSAFTVSSAPVIAEGQAVDNPVDLLPRSYGSETLRLMARDPHSLFAYWDIDWKAAFGQESPRQRKVVLRILNHDGSEHASVEVEPLAGNCYVEVPHAGAAYQGELGYFDSSGAWKVISRSTAVHVPPAMETQGEPPDFATVPFHLSFQRMTEALQASQDENRPLVAKLSDLQSRVASAGESGTIRAEERELAGALEEVIAGQPSLWPPDSAAKDLWAQYGREKIFGFGNSSLGGGFGGSSRS